MSPRTHHPRSHKEKPVTESETETILEPGDPGYVDPTAAQNQPVLEPAPAPAGSEGAAAPAPPGQDLRPMPNPGETEAEYLARTRNVAVESLSPTDIVPNRPQITFGPQEPAPVAAETETVSEEQAESESEAEAE